MPRAFPTRRPSSVSTGKGGTQILSPLLGRLTLFRYLLPAPGPFLPLRQGERGWAHKTNSLDVFIFLFIYVILNVNISIVTDAYEAAKLHPNGERASDPVRHASKAVALSPGKVWQVIQPVAEFAVDINV